MGQTSRLGTSVRNTCRKWYGWHLYGRIIVISIGILMGELVTVSIEISRGIRGRPIDWGDKHQRLNEESPRG